MRLAARLVLPLFWAALHGSAVAGDGGEIDRIVTASQRGMSMDTQLRLAEAAATSVEVDSNEAVQLLRAGVSPAVVWALSRGQHPTDREIRDAALPGPAWQVNGPAPTPDSRESPRSYAIYGPEYTDGHAFWVYLDAHIGLSAAVVTDERYTNVLVSVVNIGDASATLHPSAFGLAVGSSMGLSDATRLERVEPAAYLKQIRTAGRWRVVLEGLTAPLATGSWTTFTTFTSVGSLPVSAVGTIRSGPTTGDVIAADRYRRELIEKAAERERERLEAADDLLLRTTTLGPGEGISGVVPFLYRSAPKERFVIIFDSPGERLQIETRTRE